MLVLARLEQPKLEAATWRASSVAREVVTEQETDQNITNNGLEAIKIRIQVEIMYNYSGNSAAEATAAAINTYDPYFPSQHHVNSVNSSTSSPSVTSSVSNEDYTYQQTVLVLPNGISKNQVFLVFHLFHKVLH